MSSTGYNKSLVEDHEDESTESSTTHSEQDIPIQSDDELILEDKFVEQNNHYTNICEYCVDQRGSFNTGNCPGCVCFNNCNDKSSYFAPFGAPRTHYPPGSECCKENCESSHFVNQTPRSNQNSQFGNRRSYPHSNFQCDNQMHTNCVSCSCNFNKPVCIQSDCNSHTFQTDQKKCNCCYSSSNLSSTMQSRPGTTAKSYCYDYPAENDRFSSQHSCSIQNQRPYNNCSKHVCDFSSSVGTDKKNVLMKELDSLEKKCSYYRDYIHQLNSRNYSASSRENTTGGYIPSNMNNASQQNTDQSGQISRIQEHNVSNHSMQMPVCQGLCSAQAHKHGACRNTMGLRGKIIRDREGGLINNACSSRTVRRCPAGCNYSEHRNAHAPHVHRHCCASQKCSAVQPVYGNVACRCSMKNRTSANNGSQRRAF